MIAELVDLWRHAPTTVALAVNDWCRRQHAPVDVGTLDAPEVVCTNHWRPRVRPWPCDEYLRLTDEREKITARSNR